MSFYFIPMPVSSTDISINYWEFIIFWWAIILTYPSKVNLIEFPTIFISICLSRRGSVQNLESNWRSISVSKSILCSWPWTRYISVQVCKLELLWDARSSMRRVSTRIKVSNGVAWATGEQRVTIRAWAYLWSRHSGVTGQI